MAFKKVQESKEIGKQIIDGQELPIIQPEVHMEVKNKKNRNRLRVRRTCSTRR